MLGLAWVGVSAYKLVNQCPRTVAAPHLQQVVLALFPGLRGDIGRVECEDAMLHLWWGPVGCKREGQTSVHTSLMEGSPILCARPRSEHSTGCVHHGFCVCVCVCVCTYLYMLCPVKIYNSCDTAFSREAAMGVSYGPESGSSSNIRQMAARGVPPPSHRLNEKG